MEGFGVAFFLIIVGLGVIVFGGLIKIGWYKRWYLMNDDSIFFDKSAHYAFIPLGLSFISLGIMLLLPPLSKASSYALYTFFFLGGLGVIFFFWQPSWLKPSWVRWLEENHSDVLDILIDEARKTPNWGHYVSTRADMEYWVAGVRQKHSLPLGVTPTIRPVIRSWLRHNWPVGLVILAISSGAGQYLLDNGFIGFIGGWAILGLIYLLRPKQ
ncbi:MAG: hypothetical protein AB1801_04395 [Chloroflexota bacterium]